MSRARAARAGDRTGMRGLVGSVQVAAWPAEPIALCVCVCVCVCVCIVSEHTAEADVNVVGEEDLSGNDSLVLGQRQLLRRRNGPTRQAVPAHTSHDCCCCCCSLYVHAYSAYRTLPLSLSL
jgi:hypothetical protein